MMVLALPHEAALHAKLDVASPMEPIARVGRSGGTNLFTEHLHQIFNQALNVFTQIHHVEKWKS